MCKSPFDLGLLTLIKNNPSLTRSCINDILHLFREFTNEKVPIDSRTFLHTPRDPSRDIKTLKSGGGGQYYHFGVQRSINQVLQSFFAKNPLSSSIQIDINVDGLSIFKSSQTHFWPILGRLFGENPSGVFIIGLYSGDKKPEANEFLENLISDLSKTFEEGVVYSRKKLN